MGVIMRGLVLIPFAFISIIVLFFAGLIVPPYAAAVMDSSAVAAIGFDTGGKNLLKVGLRWTIPLLLLVGVVWVIFGDLRYDLGPR